MPEHKRNDWLVYIILANNDSLYTGITTDIKRRWMQHCGQLKGGARFFRSCKPLKIVFMETKHTHSTAAQREAAIKKLSKKQKQRLFQKTLSKKR